MRCTPRTMVWPILAMLLGVHVRAVCLQAGLGAERAYLTGRGPGPLVVVRERELELGPCQGGRV